MWQIEGYLWTYYEHICWFYEHVINTYIVRSSSTSSSSVEREDMPTPLCYEHEYWILFGVGTSSLSSRLLPSRAGTRYRSRQPHRLCIDKTKKINRKSTEKLRKVNRKSTERSTTDNQQTANRQSMDNQYKANGQSMNNQWTINGESTEKQQKINRKSHHRLGPWLGSMPTPLQVSGCNSVHNLRY